MYLYFVLEDIPVIASSTILAISSEISARLVISSVPWQFLNASICVLSDLIVFTANSSSGFTCSEKLLKFALTLSWIAWILFVTFFLDATIVSLNLSWAGFDNSSVAYVW